MSYCLPLYSKEDLSSEPAITANDLQVFEQLQSSLTLKYFFACLWMNF
jgi:hypothetical protein